MTTKELLEHASLDALGLLDDDERQEFDRSFAAAPPSVQAQVRREQLRFAKSEASSMLPPVEAPVGLRARVLAAVRDAIAAVNGPAAEPVARIGAGAPAAGVLARIHNTAPLWRAACIGFATATVVLSMFFVYIAQQNRIMRDVATANRLVEQIPGGGDAADLLLRPRMQPVAFAPAAPDVRIAGTRATLFIDIENREALLICKGLPDVDGRYSLVIEDDAEAATRTVRRFQATGGVVPVPVELADTDDFHRLAIVGPNAEGADGVILRVSAH